MKSCISKNEKCRAKTLTFLWFQCIFLTNWVSRMGKPQVSLAPRHLGHLGHPNTLHSVIYSHPTSRSPYCLHQLVGMKIHTQRNLLPHLLPLLIHRWSIFHSSRVYCEEYFTPPEPFSHFMIWTTFSLVLNPLSSAELIYLPLFLRKIWSTFMDGCYFLTRHSRPKASLPRY